MNYWLWYFGFRSLCTVACFFSLLYLGSYNKNRLGSQLKLNSLDRNLISDFDRFFSLILWKVTFRFSNKKKQKWIKKYIKDLHRTEKLNNLKLDFSQFCRILEKFGKMKLRVDIFSEIKVEIGSQELIQVKN